MLKLTNLFGTRSSVKPAARRAVLALENLEERTVLSTTNGNVAGLTYVFDYNESTHAGTLRITGTSAADNFTLVETYYNADPGEPHYGDNRPIGIDLAISGTEFQGGVSFEPGSAITIEVRTLAGNDRVVNATRFSASLDGGDGTDTLTGGADNDYTLAAGFNDPFWYANEWSFNHYDRGTGHYEQDVTG